jgi:WD40 repeat protein
MWVLKGHGYGNPVRDVAFSLDGKRLASAAGAYTVRLWDLDTGDSTVTPVGNGRAYWLAFAPHGKELAWGGGLGVYLWDLARDTVRQLPERPNGYAVRVEYSPDGRLLAAVEWDVCLWHVQDCAWLTISTGPGSTSTSLAFAPDSKTLATGQTFFRYPRHEHLVQLWDTTTRQVRGTLRGHGAAATSLAFAPNSRFLAATCGQSLLIWDVVTGATLVHHKINKQHFMDVAFTPDGRFLLLARNDKTVRVWDTQTWREQAAFDWDIGAIVSVAVAPDGMRAAAGGDKGKIVVWDLDL